MNNGGYMSVTVMMVFAFSALVASATMYVMRENNDYKILADQVDAANGAMGTAIKKLDSVKRDHFEQLDQLEAALKKNEHRMAEMDKKFRDLEYESLRPKTVNIYAKKPIPVEIMTTEKPVRAIVRVSNASKKKAPVASKKAKKKARK